MNELQQIHAYSRENIYYIFSQQRLKILFSSSTLPSPQSYCINNSYILSFVLLIFLYKSPLLHHKLAQLCSSCLKSFPDWFKFVKVAEFIICFSCSRNWTWKIKTEDYWIYIQLIGHKYFWMDISWLGWNTKFKVKT